ncbi:MAG: hypothetical protein WCO43_10790 [Chitinophagia bacterium]
MNKKVYVTAFVIMLLKSCIIDIKQRFCVVKNMSNRTIAVYFSNYPILDSNILAEQFYDSSFALKKFSSGDVMKNKYTFLDSINSKRRLYAFFLDQDSINKYYQLPLSKLIQKSLLKSQEVDIRKINSRDTLYYVE